MEDPWTSETSSGRITFERGYFKLTELDYLLDELPAYPDNDNLEGENEYEEFDKGLTKGKGTHTIRKPLRSNLR